MSDVSDASAEALPDLDEPGDAELISAVRDGDLDSYGKLFERHVDAARRLSRQLVSAGDVDDLVSEGFSKVLGVLQRGGGPDLAFRAYLLTSIRRLHIDKIRSGARLQTTDDLTPYDPGVEFEDTAVSGFENAAAAKAFASLPERWQQVLWHTEVEGQKPADVAPLLGMSANSVSALAYRAREGLRQAFVTMHAQDAATDACATARGQFGAYIRGGVSKRDAAKIEAHLKDCRECTAIYLELAEVNSNLGAVLAPIVLGTAGAGYLAAHAGAVVAVKGGVLLFLDRGKDWLLHNPAGRATGGVAGAAAAAVVVAASVNALGGHAPSKPVAHGSAAPSSVSAPSNAPSNAPVTPPVSRPQPSQAPIAPVAPVETPAATVPAVTPTHTSSPSPSPSPSPPSPVSPTTAPKTPDTPVIATPIAPVQVQSGSTSVTINLAAGATDPQGFPLTVLSASVAAPGHGSLVIGGGAGRLVVLAAAAPSAVVTYTPDAGWRGTDRIDYTLTNGHGGTVSGFVTVTTPNTAPVAHDDSVQAHVVHGGTGTSVAVLSNDSDANGDPLTITGVSGASHGAAAVVGDHVVFTPVNGYVGVATFGYTVSDGHGGTATATASITYGMEPDAAPVAHDVSVTTPYGDPATLDLAAHVSDPDGDDVTIAVGTPAHGTVSQSGDHWVYTPDHGFAGTDTFSYSASDGVDTTSATVTVHVQAHDLELEGRHPLALGYIGMHLSAGYIPDGETATLTVTIRGFHNWTNGTPDAANGAVCHAPGAPTSDDVMTLTCTVSGNGEIVHADFHPTDNGWSVDATLTADGFDAGSSSLHYDASHLPPLSLL